MEMILTLMLVAAIIGLAMMVTTGATHPDIHQEGYTTFSKIFQDRASNFHKKLIPHTETTNMRVETRAQKGDFPAAPIVDRGERFETMEFFFGNPYTVRPLKRGLKYEVDLDTIDEGPDKLARAMQDIAMMQELSINKAEEANAALMYLLGFTTTTSPDGAAVWAAPGINTGHPLGDGTYDANAGVDDGLGTGTFMHVNFSPTNYEQMYDQYLQQKGHEGEPFMPDTNVKVFCSADYGTRIKRFVKNENLAETANRDINVLMGTIKDVIPNPWFNWAGLTKFFGFNAADPMRQPWTRVDRRGRRPRTWIEEDGTIRVYVNSAIWTMLAENYRGTHATLGS